MSAEWTNSLIVLGYLAVGTIGIALAVGWLLKHFDALPSGSLADNRVREQTTDRSLDFADVMPKLQALLSGSRPVLRLKNILVPVDFTESSLRALPYASFLAGQFGCAVTLLHVVYLPMVGEERGLPLTRLLEEMKSGAQQVLDELAPAVWPTTRTVVRVGDPIAEVLKEAAESDIDLIVLGRRRCKGPWQRWLPSVEGRIMRRAPCPTFFAA